MGRVLGLVIGLAAIGALAFFLLGDDEPSDTATFDPLDESAVSEERGPGLQAMGTQAVEQTSEGTPGAYTITGRVTNEEGAPQAGVPILARRSGPAHDWNDQARWRKRTAERVHDMIADEDRSLTERPAVRARTTTGADGTFRLAVNTSGRFRVQARPDAPLFGTDAWADVHPNNLEQDVALQVRTGSTLQGRVVNLAEQPLGGTLTASWWKNDSNTYLRWSSDPTEARDEDGRFVMEGVPPGNVRLTVELRDGRKIKHIKVETPHDGEFVIRIDDATSTLEVTVTDAQGNGLEGAAVLATINREKSDDQAGGSHAIHGKTNAAGVAVFANAPVGKVGTIRVAAEGFLGKEAHSGQAEWKGLEVKPEETAQVTVALEQGGSIVGRVLTEGTEAPIEGATITLFPMRTSSGAIQSEYLMPVKTDAEGRYRVDGVARGRYVAIPEAKGWYLPRNKPREGSQMFYSPADASAPAELLVVMTEEGGESTRDLILAKGHTVQGRVIDGKGEGIGDATIHGKGYGMMQNAWQWGIQPTAEKPLATTDGDGSFEVEGLPPHDNWILYAKKKGYAGKYGTGFELDGKGTVPDVKLELQAGATIRGKIEGLDEATMAKAQVGYWGMDSELAADRSFKKANPDGTFELTGLPPGTWTINIWMNGRNGVQKQVANLEAGEVREGIILEMKQGVEVSGVVVDPDGEPVKHLSVGLQSQAAGGGWVNGQTDNEGRFEFQGVAEGRCQLMIFTGSGQKAIGKPFDAPKTDVRVVYEKDPVRVIKGKVVDPAGEPIPLARITIKATKKKNSTGGMESIAYGGPQQGTVDVLNGAFEVRVEGHPPYTATVSGAKDKDGNPLNYKSTSVPIENPEAETVITLEAGVELMGSVVDAEGKPIQGVPVRTQQRTTTTDADGVFRIAGLSPGSVWLMVGPKKGYANLPGKNVDSASKDLRFVLEPGLHIKGRVEGPDGKPVTQGWANARWKGADGQGHASAQIQSGGAFTLDGFPANVSVTISVQIWNQGGGASMAPTQVQDVRPGTEDLVIRMGAGVAIEGTVVDHEGKPVGNVYVGATAQDGSNSHSGWAQTDAKGHWKLAGLKPIKYALRVMRPGTGGQGRPTTVEAPNTGIKLTMPRTVSLSGRLSGLDGDNKGWAVRAYGPDGSVVQVTQVAEDGSWTIASIADEGEVTLGANKTGDDRYARKENVRPGSKNVTLTLEMGHTIRGTVDRSAVPQGTVSVWLSGNSWQAFAKVDENGSFALTGLPKGSYTIQARCNRAQAKAEGVVSGSEDLALTLAMPE